MDKRYRRFWDLRKGDRGDIPARAKLRGSQNVSGGDQRVKMRSCSINYRTFREPCPFSVIARSIEIYVVGVFGEAAICRLVVCRRRRRRLDPGWSAQRAERWTRFPGILNVGGWILT
jgi:hypothetical protein